jgi:hypothetical protein
MTILSNEETNIENLLLNGFKNNHINFNDLLLLAKNYYWNDKHKKIKITSLVVGFCKKWDKDFNEVIDRKIVKDAINAGIKSILKHDKEINFYKEEIDLIETIGDFKYQKIAFIMLYLSKMGHKEESQFYNLDRKKDSQVIKLSETNISRKEYKFLLQLLRERNLLFTIEPKDRFDYNQILYAKNDGEIVFSIVDLNNVIQNYVDYYGGEIFICSVCGKRKIRKNYQKLDICEDCYKEQRLEYMINLMKDKRK